MENIFVIYLIIVNIIAFILYGIDKLKAKADRWRIKEATLIGSAVIGGAYGALIGMYLFRHKTKKVKFYIIVPFCVLLYTIFFYYLFR